MRVPGATAHPLSRRAFFVRLGGRFSRKRLVQRLRHEADSKNRPPGLVQEFHSHWEFCLSLREMPLTMSAQTLVSSRHAASRSASSMPESEAPE